MPPARISLTLSRHFSLSFITSGWSSWLHPVSSHSCCMYVRAGHPAFSRPYVGVHRSTSLMSSSLLLQQCPACLVRLTWIVFVMRGRCLYSWSLVGCCCIFFVVYIFLSILLSASYFTINILFFYCLYNFFIVYIFSFYYLYCFYSLYHFFTVCIIFLLSLLFLQSISFFCCLYNFFYYLLFFTVYIIFLLSI